MWEQSLRAKRTPRFLKDRIAFIAGKPCSHSGAGRRFAKSPRHKSSDNSEYGQLSNCTTRYPALHAAPRGGRSRHPRPNGSGCRPDECSRRSPRKSWRSEEHTSELQSLMRISYAVFCLKKKKKHILTTNNT